MLTVATDRSQVVLEWWPETSCCHSSVATNVVDLAERVRANFFEPKPNLQRIEEDSLEIIPN
jgi:hypothetical protein